MNAFKLLRGATPSLLFCLTLSVSASGQSKTNAPIQFHNSPSLAPSPGYSQSAVVTSGKLIFLAGQVGADKSGHIAKDDFNAQAKQAFENLKTILAENGATPANLVKLNYYVVGLNPDRLKTLRSIRDQYVDIQHPPVSTLAGVNDLFREECLIEIEAVAVIP
jgi:enamine deaminase RidA (YjgF/YER057c/UK114 family)